MVFDGCAPLVRRWNGYVPSSKSTERITPNYKYPKLQLTQIYNNVRGEAERITPNYNYPKLQLPKLQLPQIYNYVCVIISWLVRLHGRSSTGGRPAAGDVRSRRAPGGPLGGPCGPLGCLLYTSPSPRDRTRSRMPSSA